MSATQAIQVIVIATPRWDAPAYAMKITRTESAARAFIRKEKKRDRAVNCETTLDFSMTRVNG